MIEIHLILCFMIVAAIVAIEARDLLSSVIAVGAVGIGLSMAFLVLKAPELAIMQLVVEILCLIILIRGTIRHDLPFSTSGRWYFNTAATVIFFVSFFGFALVALRGLRAIGSNVSPVAEGFIEVLRSGAGKVNVVAAIIHEVRGYDVLIEMAIIFAAMVGVLAVGRTKAVRKGRGHDA